MAAKPKVTRDDYFRLLAAYRDHPGESSLVARTTGLARITAWRAWHEGWQGLRLPPIKEALSSPDIMDTLQQETEVATPAEAPSSSSPPPEVIAAKASAIDVAREARQQINAKADARDDAVTVLDEERRLRKGGRAVAGQNLVASARWGKAHQTVAEEIVRRVENERSEMSLNQLADLARVMATVDRQRMALLREAAELERLHRGDPSVIVGVTPTEMSTEEAIKEIERANLTLTRYKRRGLALISGGDQEQEPEGPVVNVTPAG